MLFPRSFRSLITGKQNQRRSSKRRTRFARRSETLEDRTLLSAFVVTNTNDAGAGSFRQAILDANANAGGDTIDFNIAASDPNFVDVDSAMAGGDAAADVFVIRPLSALPAFSDAAGGTTIDGGTQTTFGGDTNSFGPEVVLDGSLAGSVDGIAIRSDDNAVLGLNIQQFGRDGIDIFGGDDNRVAGNYIGTDATGTLDRGNGSRGILVWGAGVSNLIGTDGDGSDDAAERNIISGNSGSGVRIFGAGTNQTVVAGNYIGTDVTGTIDLGNSSRGVQIDTGPTASRVGTDGDGVSDVAERNVLSGNSQQGVLISNSDGNVVAGNFIGTDASGTADLGNSRDGITIQSGAEFNIIGTNGDGVADTAERNVVSGNSQRGITISASDSNVIAGNFIGIDVTGSVDLGNSREGVVIRSGADFNIIGTNGDGTADTAERNVISGNNNDGIEISGADSNTVAGNYIGIDVTGSAALGNALSGVFIGNGNSNRIGTNGDGVSDSAERNVISANRNGVRITAASTQNVIAGNYIGTNAAGTQVVGSAIEGVQFIDFFDRTHSNRIGTDGNGVADAAEGNVIAGHRQHGIQLRRSHDNVVAGNYVGTDATGTVALGNGRGIAVDNDAQRNRIGTNADGVSDDLERNIVSGNRIWGVIMFSAGTIDNVYAGNYIGVDATGAGPLGNGVDGVFVGLGANANRIGTNGDGVRDSAEGNIIAYNGGDGVKVRDLETVGNSIRGNSIHSNVELGIDLNFDGTDDDVTSNDAGDADVGGNNLQNFPEIKNAVSLPLNRTLVVGTVNAAANVVLTLDFYASAQADPSGFGEGERWLGSLVVMTDAAGIADFTTILLAASTGGEVLTATATATDGSTSEFSEALTIKETTGGEESSTLLARQATNGESERAEAARRQQASRRGSSSGNSGQSSSKEFQSLVFDADDGSDSHGTRLVASTTDLVLTDFELLAELLTSPIEDE